jgi:hypothetical protein
LNVGRDAANRYVAGSAMAMPGKGELFQVLGKGVHAVATVPSSTPVSVQRPARADSSTASQTFWV